jgi:hypothetical protein
MRAPSTGFGIRRPDKKVLKIGSKGSPGHDLMLVARLDHRQRRAHRIARVVDVVVWQCPEGTCYTKATQKNFDNFKISG